MKRNETNDLHHLEKRIGEALECLIADGSAAAFALAFEALELLDEVEFQQPVYRDAWARVRAIKATTDDDVQTGRDANDVRAERLTETERSTFAEALWTLHCYLTQEVARREATR